MKALLVWVAVLIAAFSVPIESSSELANEDKKDASLRRSRVLMSRLRYRTLEENKIDQQLLEDEETETTVDDVESKLNVASENRVDWHAESNVNDEKKLGDDDSTPISLNTQPSHAPFLSQGSNVDFDLNKKDSKGCLISRFASDIKKTFKRFRGLFLSDEPNVDYGYLQY